MRVVGYARESAGAEDARPAFAQQEEIRRWIAEQGHHLVAVCQDSRQAGHALGRHGYLALLGTVGSGGVDAVVVPGIETLSSDQIVQEIILWDLQSRGVRVLSTHDDDLVLIGDADPGPTRMLIRDVLIRVAEHAETMTDRPMERPAGGTDVVVELLAPADDDPDPAPTAAAL